MYKKKNREESKSKVVWKYRASYRVNIRANIKIKYRQSNENAKGNGCIKLK